MNRRFSLLAQVAAPVGDPWTPAELTPAVWLDAQGLSAASPWDDLSSNNNDATTNSGTVTLASNQIGGFQAVDFSGNGRQQLAADIFGPTRRVRTDLIVCRGLSQGTQPRHIYGQGSTVTSFVNTYGHGFFYNGSFLGFKSNNNSTTNGVLLSGFSPSNTEFIALHRCQLEGSTYTNQLWINGELAVSNTQNFAPWAYTTTFLGRTPSSGNEFWNGSIGMVFSQLSAVADADIDRLFGYAAHRWNITSVLPSGHPYKTAAPTV